MTAKEMLEMFEEEVSVELYNSKWEQVEKFFGKLEERFQEEKDEAYNNGTLNTNYYNSVQG